MSNIDHPFYCTFCGEVLSSQSEFDAHYKEEMKAFNRFNSLDKDQVFDLVYNENNY